MDEYTIESKDMNELHDELPSLVFALCNYKTTSEKENSDAKILHLIDTGCDVNVRHPRTGMTATMMAIQDRRSDETIVKLINAGTDVNLMCKKNKTALIYALENYSSKRVMRELLNKGSDVNILYDSYKAIFYATSIGVEPDIIEMLLNAGSSVDSNDDYPSFMLALCCLEECTMYDNCRYKRVIDILIEKGVDLKATDSDGNTIIHLAYCTYAIHMALKNGLSIEKRNNAGMTPLLRSLRLREENKVIELLLIGADPNCLDNNGYTPLFNANVITYERFTNLLLFHGAELLVKNSYEFPLMNQILGQNIFYNTLNDESGIRALIKHYLLYVDENGLFELRRNIYNITIRDQFDLFVRFCRSELCLMRNTLLKNDLSIYNFCQLKKFYRNKFIRIKIPEYNYDYEMISEVFPIFKDIIFLRLEDNSRKMFESNMLRILEKISINVYMDNGRCVEIVYDCWYRIGKYLNFIQLYELFLASLDRS